MAMNAVAKSDVSVALACRAFQISETCYRYSPVLSDENEQIEDWLKRLTANKRTWGFGLCFLYLRNGLPTGLAGPKLHIWVLSGTYSERISSPSFADTVPHFPL